MHYSFPAKLHNDKGANFESKVIKKLCNLACFTKTRTTPCHPMGNGLVERFNKTLLNMMGTLPEEKKGNWPTHVSTLTHAYNAAIHERTGFSPYFLMFGRQPPLAVDAFLGLTENRSQKDYADKLKDRLKTAFNRATEEIKKKGVKYKHYYDQKVRNATVEVGDRVLVKKVGIKGKHKFADIWEPYIYVVVKQPMPGIPVYSVQKEGSNAKPKLLHHNMLLPFYGLPVPEKSASEDEEEAVMPSSETEVSEDTTDSDSSSDTDDRREPAQKYVIPARRGQPEKGRALPDHMNNEEDKRREVQRRPRPQRARKPPDRLQLDDWRVDSDHTRSQLDQKM